MAYSKGFQDIAQEIEKLMQGFTHTKKDIGYGYRWTFTNRMWFDIIDYKKQDKVILRVGRGAWLVKTYPVLYSLFDEVLKVIAKVEVHSTDTLYEKDVLGLFGLLDKAPRGASYSSGCKEKR